MGELYSYSQAIAGTSLLPSTTRERRCVRSYALPLLDWGKGLFHVNVMRSSGANIFSGRRMSSEKHGIPNG
jgi:hypothetical protein